MNLFSPPKKVSKLYISDKEHSFILLSLFIFKAHKEKWNNNDIKKVVEEARKSNYKHLIKTLKEHSG